MVGEDVKTVPGQADLRAPALGWRALLAAAATVAPLVGAQTAVVRGLAVVALVAAVERLARRGRGGVDSLLLGVGGVLVAVLLTGAVLRVSPLGLSTTTWATSLGLVSLGCLAVATRLPRADSITREDWSVAARALPWAIAVVAVATLALGLSSRSVDAEGVVGGSGASRSAAAPLQMSLGTVDGGRVQVVVTAGRRTGPVELRTTSEDGVEIDYPLFTVAAGASYSTVLAVPDQGRYVISLVDPDRTRPLRSLVLDR